MHIWGSEDSNWDFTLMCSVRSEGLWSSWRFMEESARLEAIKYFWKTSKPRSCLILGNPSLLAEYFTGWLAPRAINGLGDYFAFGLLPRISGIYSKQMLAFTDLPYAEPQIDAVFLSHTHFDHINHLLFLDPQIPIHLGVGTKLFMDSIEETSSFCNYAWALTNFKYKLLTYIESRGYISG